MSQMYGRNYYGNPTFNDNDGDEAHPTMGSGSQQSPSGKGHDISPQGMSKGGHPHSYASKGGQTSVRVSPTDNANVMQSS